MDITSTLKEFIKPELFVLVPVMYILGLGLRQVNLDNKWIPLILGAVGVMLSLLYIFGTSNINGGGDTAMAIFTSVTQGVLCAGGSVYIDQIIKQVNK